LGFVRADADLGFTAEFGVKHSLKAFLETGIENTGIRKNTGIG